MFLDNTALTWMLVILNVMFFISVFAGLLFASFAASDMKNAKAAKKDAEKLYAEQSKIWADRQNELNREIGIAKLRCKISGCGCQHE